MKDKEHILKQDVYDKEERSEYYTFLAALNSVIDNISLLSLLTPNKTKKLHQTLSDIIDNISKFKKSNSQTINTLQHLSEELNNNYVSTNWLGLFSGGIGASAGVITVASTLVPVFWPVTVGGLIVSSVSAATGLIGTYRQSNWKRTKKSELQKILEENDSIALQLRTSLATLEMCVADLLRVLRHNKITALGIELPKLHNARSAIPCKCDTSQDRKEKVILNICNKAVKVKGNQEHSANNLKQLKDYQVSKQSKQLEKAKMGVDGSSLVANMTSSMGKFGDEGVSALAKTTGKISKRSGAMVTKTASKLGRVSRVAGTSVGVIGVVFDVYTAITAAIELSKGNKDELHTAVEEIIHLLEEDSGMLIANSEDIFRECKNIMPIK